MVFYVQEYYVLDVSDSDVEISVLIIIAMVILMYHIEVTIMHIKILSNSIWYLRNDETCSR